MNEQQDSNSPALADSAPVSGSSPVNQMFNNRSIFITGASGFIGRVLLEKLLRTYQGINKVYILMRTKKNQQPYDRLHKQLLKVPIFDQIRSMKNGQELLDKIIVIPGDIAEPNLGISDEDMSRMLKDETLSMVFHSAATIKFDEPLKVSIRLNLKATQIILDLCKKLPNLIGLCHVSTAYVNSDIKDNSVIEEKYYPMKDDPKALINLAEILDENLLQELKAKLVDERPNTYTYTKAAAEQLILQEANNLPVAIIRPSIVVAAWKEPLPGWIDNLNGPTGLLLAIGKGLLRTMYCNTSIKADIVPVDIVVNSMITSIYYTAKLNNKLDCEGINYNNNNSYAANNSLASLPKEVQPQQPQNQKSKQCNGIKPTTTTTNGCKPKPLEASAAAAANESEICDDSGASEPGKRLQALTKEEQVPVIHVNSGDINPITWSFCENMFFPIVRRYPSGQVLRYPYGTFKNNKYHDLLMRIFVHFIPALILDTISSMLGKKRQLFSIYRKVHMATEALAHFTTQNYNYQTKNIAKLQKCLEHPLDQQQLYMNIKDIKWAEFWDMYVLGAR